MKCTAESEAFGGNPIANAIARRGRKAVRVRESAYDACWKLRLVTALTKRGIWAAFRDWLVETDLYDLFLAAMTSAFKNMI